MEHSTMVAGSGGSTLAALQTLAARSEYAGSRVFREQSGRDSFQVMVAAAD